MLGFAVYFLMGSGFAVAEELSSKLPVSPKVVTLDTNKDGKPDRWEHHEGVNVRVEADTNFDGAIDEKAYFENEKLIRGEKDTDYDGKMDKWIDY